MFVNLGVIIIYINQGTPFIWGAISQLALNLMTLATSDVKLYRSLVTGNILYIQSGIHASHHLTKIGNSLMAQLVKASGQRMYETCESFIGPQHSSMMEKKMCVSNI